MLRQRDTYFAVAHGRLKLREEEPGGATLIAYERPDAASERVSSYRLVPVAEPAPLRDALRAASGVTARVVKRRHLLLWETVRIHLDEVRGLGSFLELEAVAEPGSDLSRERAPGRALRELLEIADDALREGSYADALSDGAAPGRGARSPSCSRWRATRPGGHTRPTRTSPSARRVRTADGRRYAGANVENAAYPQGQCAEASAIGALVAGGGGRSPRPSWRRPAASSARPCGGCRQRLREFMADDAPIHLADLERVRRTTTLGELLPLSFGPEHLAA